MLQALKSNFYSVRRIRSAIVALNIPRMTHTLYSQKSMLSFSSDT